MSNVGFGCKHFSLGVYIANIPNMSEYKTLSCITPLTQDEIYTIGQACGNGWCKVFNVYAKLIYALNVINIEDISMHSSWQKYRDELMLQPNSKIALLFSSPQITKVKANIKIICGRTYAKSLLNTGDLKANFIWLDDEFAIDKHNQVIVCPYFDYRQLSNIKIEKLKQLILSLTE
ncbi:DUF6942 family protein [Colwellia sp. RSH04]|uniref:DUF6942 family protein n=1 Tax=Colwellia sp. RSH04 TaxID=2305464 RepID=UPI000E593371|nr:hypothetical protein [Colwellia sp. RSH04]RHW76133.1 hypothetical protein D1094_10775 [Colwellia sp. RSH04]